MRKIEFLKVSCENYCGYIEPIDLEFKSNKIIMIVGKNGVGKSTLFSIIPYALYGMTQTGLRAEDVINKKTKKNCHAHVEFKIDDDVYSCDRYLKYRKMGSSKVILSKNGEVFKTGHTEVTAEVERLIMPRQLFFNTVLFGQKVSTFFTDLTDSQQKDIFRKILNLEIYKDYQKIAAEKIKDCDLEKDNILHTVDTNDQLILQLHQQNKEIEDAKIKFEERKIEKINELNTKNTQLISFVTGLEENIVKFNEEEIKEKLEISNKFLNSVTEQKTLLDEKANGYYSLLKEKQKGKITQISSQYATKIQNQTSTLNKTKMEITDNLTKEIQEIDKDINKVKDKVGELKNNLFEVDYFIKQVSELIEKYEKLLNTKNAPCPLCFRPLGEEHTPQLQKQWEIENVKVEEANKKKNKIEKNIEVYLKEIEILEDEKKKCYDESRNEIDNISIQIKDIEEQLKDEKEEKINEINELVKVKMEEAENKHREQSDALIDKIERAEKDRDKFSDSLVQLESLKIQKVEVIGKIESQKALIQQIQDSEYDLSVIEKNNEQILEIEDKTNKLKETIEKVEKVKHIYEFWKVGFSSAGIPSMLIDEAIPFMNKRVNEYLDMISGGRYIVAFDTLQQTKAGDYKDKFNIRFYDNVTHADGRQLLSGGQTKIVDIATILTLSDLQEHIQGVSINIMLFDEIFDALDDDNIQNISNVLRKIVRNKCLNIISHRHIDQIEADEILKL